MTSFKEGSKKMLKNKKCLPCIGTQAPLKGKELKALSEELGKSWEVIEEHHLGKTFIFKNFKEALAFVNAIGKIAEEEHHHPDIFLAWGKVKIELWTHAIKGLSENDFVLAAKIDALHTSQGLD